MTLSYKMRLNLDIAFSLPPWSDSLGRHSSKTRNNYFY